LSTNIGQLTAPTFIIPRRLEELPRPPEASGEGSTAAITEWAQQFGGIYADEMGVAFLARGATSDLLLINDIRVEVVRRDPPVRGVWLAPGGAGGEDSRILLADLDQDPPALQRVGFNGAWNFPLSVSSGDLETFSVIAQAKSCDCSWIIKVNYQDADGNLREATIDNDGDPFRVTGSSNATAITYAPRSPEEPWPNTP